MNKFERGTQIAYIPNHANGTVLHDDVEFGFVTSSNAGTVFCRYWSKYYPGELRTKANSEGCNPENLILYDSVSPRKVEEALRDYC